MSRNVRSARAFAMVIAASVLLVSSTAGAATFDAVRPAGSNFDKAEFRLWYPDAATRLRGLILLVPGSNGDGRPQVEEPFWQDLAAHHAFGLVGVHLTDKPHENMVIEHYVEVGQGSGDALLAALGDLARESGHPEVATVPWLLWGMSAGGQFNYELALWKPERVIGFIVNKGGIYYSALAPEAARRVPGLFFIGEADLEFRNDIVAGIFAINRRVGALWGVAVEPGVGHEVARSKEMAAMFFEDLIDLRLPDEPPVGAAPVLDPLDPDQGWVADPKTRAVVRAADAPETRYPTAWLPTERLANAWTSVVSGQPF